MIDSCQIRAARHRDGPMLVIAGPGSGKTTVITERTRWLIEGCGVPPSEILVLTFTRAAAGEMRERFLRMTQGKNYPVCFGTFHAVFFMILKESFHYSASDILREEEKYAFFKERLYAHSIVFDDEHAFIGQLIREISQLKNSGALPEACEFPGMPAETFRRICQEYQEELRRRHGLDFDDILIRCRDLLTEHPEVRSAWQQRFSYILVDEFQDINPLQYQIVRMLAEPERNLFLVGDDDQSIYRFRGAKPELMLRVPQDYPDLIRVSLSVNYRSGAAIVSLASQLISRNRERYEKQIRPGCRIRDRVFFRQYDSQQMQNLSIIGEIRRLLYQGMPAEEIAVLARTGRQLMLLTQQMAAYSIPYHSRDHIPDPYHHWITDDILCYLRAAVGSCSRSAILRIMNRPNRFLSRDGLPDPEVNWNRWMAYYRNKNMDWLEGRVRRLQEDLKQLGGMRPYAALIYIRKGIGYEAFLQEYAESHGTEAEELMDLLDAVTAHAVEYPSLEAWLAAVERIRKQVRRRPGPCGTEEKGVTVGTYHSSKGLEFDAVFLPDLNERLIPHKRAVLEADLEEERRMLYVAITRARKRLYLLVPAHIRNKETEPSRFLKEMNLENALPSPPRQQDGEMPG
ncbi:MAG: ATP-dependent helicase [Lachnospiraceae bacterium]|nr:ATP-dependent helicase [Lachnospiraceae bacterium]MCI2195387.1 ATP-dependent helicase [Lachnospiraceae bacterium]